MRSARKALLASAAIVTLGTGTAHAEPNRAAIEACVNASDEGQVLRDEGKYVDAIKAFRACAQPSCPAIVQRNCVRWAESAEETVPTIVFAARAVDDSALPGDTAVEIDGVRALDRLSGTPVAVDPGRHVFTFRRSEGAKPVVKQVETMVDAGEKNRLVVVRFDVARPVLAPAPATTSPPPPPADRDRDRATRIAPIVLGAVGLTAVAVFAVVGGGAASDLHALERSSCADTGTCNAADVRSVRTRFLVADITLGGGIAALVAAGALFWLSQRSTATSTAAR